MEIPRIAVLMACYNRKSLTLSAIKALLGSAHQVAELDIFLVDDASTDGTAATVAESFPAVKIINGSGNLFWNGAMRVAWLSAIESGQYDFYLWLNDDLSLNDAAITELISAYTAHKLESRGRLLIVGGTVSRLGQSTYGALCQDSTISRLRFRNAISENDSPVTMNGNCVLIPSIAVDEVGINSKAFTHAFGDIDYGLRATKAGYKIVQVRAPVGEQERGPAYSKMAGKGISALIRYANNPKGMPWREWGVFCLRHGGIMAPFNFMSMYIKQLR